VAASFLILIVHELRFPETNSGLRIVWRFRPSDLSVSLIVAMSFALYGTGLLNPIFLQEADGLHGVEGGPGTGAARAGHDGFSMLLIGQLARFKFDTAARSAVGFILMATSLWTMSKWNLNVSSWVVIWPSITMGVGMGFIFRRCRPRPYQSSIASGGIRASLYNNIYTHTRAKSNVSALLRPPYWHCAVPGPSSCATASSTQGHTRPPPEVLTYSLRASRTGTSRCVLKTWRSRRLITSSVLRLAVSYLCSHRVQAVASLMAGPRTRFLPGPRPRTS